MAIRHRSAWRVRPGSGVADQGRNGDAGSGKTANVRNGVFSRRIPATKDYLFPSGAKKLAVNASRRPSFALRRVQLRVSMRYERGVLPVQFLNAR